MDARTAVQPQQPSPHSWLGKGRTKGPSGPAVVEVDRVVGEATERDQRLSVDPLRATDRYRLVMPYAEQV